MSAFIPTAKPTGRCFGSRSKTERSNDSEHDASRVNCCPDPGISRFPCEVSRYVHGVSDCAGLWHASRYRCAPDGAFRFSLQRRRPGVNLLCGWIPHVPLSTLRRRPCEGLRMTRGRYGSLLHCGEARSLAAGECRAVGPRGSPLVYLTEFYSSRPIGGRSRPSTEYPCRAAV
jgi:hypothetical protein